MTPKSTNHSRPNSCENRNRAPRVAFRRTCWDPQFKNGSLRQNSSVPNPRAPNVVSWREALFLGVVSVQRCVSYVAKQTQIPSRKLLKTRHVARICERNCPRENPIQAFPVPAIVSPCRTMKSTPPKGGKAPLSPPHPHCYISRFPTAVPR